MLHDNAFGSSFLVEVIHNLLELVEDRVSQSKWRIDFVLLFLLLYDFAQFSIVLHELFALLDVVEPLVNLLPLVGAKE